MNHLFEYSYQNPINSSDPEGLWVKRCSRELGGPNKPPTDRTSYLRHDFINVSGTVLSFQSGGEGLNMLWSQGWIDRNEYQFGGCTMFCDGDRFDPFVFKAADIIGAPKYCINAYYGTLPYSLGARNCQTWVDDVLNLAKEMYLKDPMCCKCFK